MNSPQQPTACTRCPYDHAPGTSCPPGFADVTAEGGDTASGLDRVAFPSRHGIRRLALAVLVAWTVLFVVGAALGWIS